MNRSISGYRDLLLPGLAGIESQVPGTELDLVVHEGTGDLRIVGWRTGGEGGHSETIATRAELEGNKLQDTFGPRALAFARKLRDQE